VHEISGLKTTETTCWVFGGLIARIIFSAYPQTNVNIDQHKLYVAMQMSPDSLVLGLLKLRNGRLRN